MSDQIKDVTLRKLVRDLAQTEPAHLDFALMAAYAEGSADGIDREIVTGHIAECAMCRREVRDLQAFATPRRRFLLPLAVAAAIAVTLITGIFVSRREADPWATRSLTIPSEALTLRSTGLALRGSSHAAPLEPLSPIGRIVVTDRPEFEWTAVTGATYRVEVFDERFRPVAASGDLTVNRWAPPALPRGATYLWQVTARVADHVITAPAPPAPEARFRVLDASHATAIARLEREESRPSTALGVAYAEAGALDEAEQELQAVVARHPDERDAARFLRLVQARTR